MIVGIDIGGTNFRIGGLDSNNEVINFKKLNVNDVLKSNDVLYDIKNMINDNFSKEDIEAISIGFPGTISKDKKVVVQVPNVKGMNNLNAVDYLHNAFNVPVYIDRDVNMLIEYDLFNSKIKNENIIIAVYYGTGIGNTILINGEPISGKDGTAGELGHIPVDDCDYVCGCGNIGCMEAVAGGKYLAKLCEEKFKNTHISDVFVKHHDDVDVIKFVDRMSMALTSEINILNPDTIIVGGGIVNMKDFPFDLFMDCIKKHTRKPYPLNSLNIVFVKDDEQKGVIGACLYAKNKMAV